MNRVVVTGIGAITPLGNDVETFWRALLDGKSGAGLITKIDASGFKTRFACEVRDFDSLNYVERKDLKKYDLFTLYALASAKEALSHSGILEFSNLDREAVGVIWGSGNGGITSFEDQMSGYFRQDPQHKFSPFFIPRRILNIASGAISITYGFKGPTFAISAACSSANNAIVEALNYIRWGKAQVMIAGGSEAPITYGSLGGLTASNALSTNNDDMLRASKPFDVNRDGFVLGEGAGALVLESLEHAHMRGAVILAEIVGGALVADAYHITGVHPRGEGAARGMKLALKDAGVLPSDIDYVNAHGTSTQAGDLSELCALMEVFGPQNDLLVGSTKSMTGHLLGATGAVEAISCVKSLMHGLVPPTINTQMVEPVFENAFDYILETPKSKSINYAINNTFGFGGHISCSVFKKWGV